MQVGTFEIYYLFIGKFHSVMEKRWTQLEHDRVFSRNNQANFKECNIQPACMWTSKYTSQNPLVFDSLHSGKEFWRLRMVRTFQSLPYLELLEKKFS